MDFVMDVLRTFSDVDGGSSLSWRCDEEYAPVSFFLNCNDTFAWACADGEDITPETLPLLKQAIAEVQAATETNGWHTAWGWTDLFAARVRQMRPQGACYKHYDERLWPLFDACGPKREVGLGNPKAHPLDLVEA